jgi:hypothetical protein
MSCLKHTQRSRKNCPDCYPLNPDLFIGEPVKVEEKIIIESTPTGDNVFYDAFIKEPDTSIDLDEYYSFKNEGIVKSVDEIVAKKIKDITKEINSIISIKHESLDILLHKFNMKVMDALLNDGWKLIGILTKEVAKVSGFKEDTVIFQRVRSDSWKKQVDHYKQLYKDTK